MEYTNWHLSGNANRAKTEPVTLQSMYGKEHFSSHTLQLSFYKQGPNDTLHFCSVRFDEQEAKRIYELLKKHFAV